MPNQSNKNARPNVFQRTSTLFATTRTNRKDYKSTASISPPTGTTSNPLATPPPSSSPKSSHSPTTPPVSLERSISKASRHNRYSQSVYTVDLQSLRRSVSLRSTSSPHRHNRVTSTATLAISPTQEYPPPLFNSAKPLLHVPAFTKRQKSADNVRDFEPPSSGGMAMASGMQSVQYRNTQPGRPPTAHSQSYSQASGGLGPAPAVPNTTNGPLNPQTVYQHILDTCSKRISTLDYLRKAYVHDVHPSHTVILICIKATRDVYTGSTRSSSQKPTSYDFPSSNPQNSPVAQQTTSSSASPSPRSLT